VPSGIIMALDKDTGKKLWEFNVGAPVGIGGPSIGHGMLFVTTGSPAEVGSNKGGYIVAFGLPENDTNANADAHAAKPANNSSSNDQQGTSMQEDVKAQTNASSQSQALASTNATQTDAKAEKLASDRKTPTSFK